jgi:hypothetical protein
MYIHKCMRTHVKMHVSPMVMHMHTMFLQTYADSCKHTWINAHKSVHTHILIRMPSATCACMQSVR